MSGLTDYLTIPNDRGVFTQTGKYLDQQKVYQALFEARKEFATVRKTAENPYFDSKYANLQTLIQATEPALQKHGIIITQLPGEFVEGKFLTLTTVVYHTPSGQSIETRQQVPAYKSGKDKSGGDGVMRIDAQSYGSALTYARRYAYQSILGLVAEDDDGNGTVEREEEEAPRKATRKKKETTPEPDPTEGFPTKEDRLKIATKLRSYNENERQISALIKKTFPDRQDVKKITQAEWDGLLQQLENAKQAGKLEEVFA